MCPGMRPATGWIAYLTSTPSPRAPAATRAPVLGCANRHPVAGCDHDQTGVGELDRDVLAVVERTVPPVAPAAPAGAATSPPKPPATIAGTERFIALAIRFVRIVPGPHDHPGDDHRGF